MANETDVMVVVHKNNGSLDFCGVHLRLSKTNWLTTSGQGNLTKGHIAVGGRYFMGNNVMWKQPVISFKR